MFPSGVDHEEQHDTTMTMRKRATNCEMIVLGEGIFRNTVAALLTMQEIRRGSSTYNHFSLPPLNLPDVELVQPIL